MKIFYKVFINKMFIITFSNDLRGIRINISRKDSIGSEMVTETSFNYTTLIWYYSVVAKNNINQSYWIYGNASRILYYLS